MNMVYGILGIIFMFFALWVPIIGIFFFVLPAICTRPKLHRLFWQTRFAIKNGLAEDAGKESIYHRYKIVDGYILIFADENTCRVRMFVNPDGVRLDWLNMNFFEVSTMNLYLNKRFLFKHFPELKVEPKKTERQIFLEAM